MKNKLFLSLLAACVLAINAFAQPTPGKLDSKYIASNYYKGVVKILLVDSVLEKQKKGSGYVGRGSGFVVSDDGVIFTNRHVVEYCVKGYIDYDYKDANGNTVQGYDTYSSEIVNSSNIVKVYNTGYTACIVQVYTGKGESDYKLYSARVLTIGTGSFDGAMVKIVSDLSGNPVYEKFFSLPIGNSDAAQQGEDLCVYGYPAQYDGNYETMLKDMSTLTFGKLSGYDYVFNKDYGYIKTDAAINGGNSGGPVFNETNKVIGIATAVGVKTGIGLVGGINGMYYVCAPKSDILTKLTPKGLTIPKNAGSINTILGNRLPIKSASELNGGGNTNKYTNNNTNTNTNTSGGAQVYCTIDVKSDGTGDPVSSLVISSSGSYAYFVVDNYPNNIGSSGLIVDVWKKNSSGSYTDFVETKEFDLPTSVTTTTYFKYTFYTAGEFKVMVYTKESKLINSAIVTTSIKGGSSGNNSGGSGVYSGAKCFWAVDIDNLKADGTGADDATSIIISPSGSYAYLVVTNYPSTLQTDGLIVDVYKKSGSEYTFVETKEYTLSTGLKTTYIKYSFYNKGEYKFNVYNKDSKFIGAGYVTVKFKS